MYFSTLTLGRVICGQMCVTLSIEQAQVDGTTEYHAKHDECRCTTSVKCMYNEYKTTKTGNARQKGVIII